MSHDSSTDDEKIYYINEYHRKNCEASAAALEQTKERSFTIEQFIEQSRAINAPRKQKNQEK